MAAWRILWMPGDGIGKDVLEAAHTVLDRLNLDAEYIPADIGWEFWKKEGNALPEKKGKVRTYAMGGSSATIEMAKTVAEKL